MTYLMADTVTGVWEVETLEGEHCKVLSQVDFYDSLSSLSDGEVIATKADAEFCSKIESEYGISWIQ